MTKATQRTYLYHYCIPLGANGNGYYHGVISVSDPISWDKFGTSSSPNHANPRPERAPAYNGVDA